MSPAMITSLAEEDQERRLSPEEARRQQVRREFLADPEQFR